MYNTMIQDIQISVDLTREPINELGRQQSYLKNRKFPVEVNTIIEMEPNVLNQIDPSVYYKIRYKKLHPDAKIIQPRPGDAGYDLCALEKDIIWSLIDDETGEKCHNEVKVKTGIAIEIPGGYVGLIRDRGSFGGKGIIVCGGVIDSVYRGELIVCLRNVGYDNYVINKGDKVAQLVIVPCYTPTLVEVDELDETERGDKGFGSTGK